MKRSLIALLSCTLVLTLGEGLLSWSQSRKPIGDMDLEPVRVDAATHELEADLKLTLRKASADTAVSVETTMGEDTDTTELTAGSDGCYTGRLSFPMDGQGACVVEAVITQSGVTKRETLRRYEDVSTLLPVRLKKYWRVEPKHQEGTLGIQSGVLTTRVYDLDVAGVESGSAAIELRGYCGDTLAQVIPGEWDADSGLYSTGDLEVPCKLGDVLRITILCQDAGGVAYEFTVGRWKVTASGAQELPELEQYKYPALIWPE